MSSSVRPNWLVLLVLSAALGVALPGCAVMSSAPPRATTTPVTAVSGSAFNEGRCPRAPQPAMSSDVAGAAARLIPFRPEAVLVCRYGGLNSGHSQQLVAHDSLSSASRIDALVRAVNAASDHRWIGSYSCPSDSETITIISASGPSDAIALRADRTGCPTISNGSITNAQIGPLLDRRLTALVGPAGT